MALTRDEILAAQALPGWRWMPGMLRDDGHRFVGIDGSNGEETGWVTPAEEGADTHWCWPIHLVEARCYVDPTDPATGGCLLALLGDQLSVTRYQRGDGEWAWCVELGGIEAHGATPGEACVRGARARGRWGA